jgi:hypothetical protein
MSCGVTDACRQNEREQAGFWHNIREQLARSQQDSKAKVRRMT